MKIEGVEITQEQIDAALIVMGHKDGGLFLPFTCDDVERALIRAGVPGPIKVGPSYRATDRILQRERNAGRIKWMGGSIGWIKA